MPTDPDDGARTPITELESALAIISRSGFSGRLTVRLTHGEEIIIEQRTGNGGGYAPPGVKLFSSMEEAILMAFDGADWLHAQRLAEVAGYANSSHFRSILSNLADRGVIESGQRGYRLVT